MLEASSKVLKMLPVALFLLSALYFLLSKPFAIAFFRGVPFVSSLFLLVDYTLQLTAYICLFRSLAGRRKTRPARAASVVCQNGVGPDAL